MNKDTVLTIDGTVVEKSKCRNIRGEFYIIGDPTIENSGHCYFINEKYYKQDTGYIVYNHSLKTYVVKNNTSLLYGIIGFSDKDTPTLGYFSISEYNDSIIISYKNERYPCMDESILENTNFKENLSDNIYYHRQSIRSSKFSKIGNIPPGFKNNLLYDSNNLISNKSSIYNELYEPKYIDSIKQYGEVLKGLTFGLEFETINGYVPERLCNKLGLIPLRDGSIQGLEYVTIPLQNSKGMQTIIDSVKQLSKRTIYDNDCSLHLHIGNVPRTEEFMLALFKMLCLLENSLFELFPVYKKYNYGVKKKHYTKPFTLNESMYLLDRKINDSNIKENFNVLYKYLSMGQDYSDVSGKLSNVKYHPSDPRGEAKWNIRTRYHWVNLIPLLFGNKQTIEFRLHTPTYDIDKVLNYLVICGSIVNFVKDNTAKILNDFSSVSNLSLSDILYSTIMNNKDIKNSNRLLDNLMYYISTRRNFMYHQAQKGNIKANEDDFNIRDTFWLKNTPKESKSPLTYINVLDEPFRARGRRGGVFEALEDGLLRQEEINAVARMHEWDINRGDRNININIENNQVEAPLDMNFDNDPYDEDDENLQI